MATATKKKVLGLTRVTSRYSITLTKNVMDILKGKKKLEQSQELGFSLHEETNRIVLILGKTRKDELLLGANRISTKNTVVIPEAVRVKLKPSAGDEIVFYLDDDGRISIEVQKY